MSTTPVTRPVQFTRESAERIARVVRNSELQPAVLSPLVFDFVQSPQKRIVFRVGTFAGSWAINETKTVTLLNAATTLPAVNIFAGIGTSAAATRNCAIAKDGTAWYLIAAQC